MWCREVSVSRLHVMYVCMHVCMYVCMYALICVCSLHILLYSCPFIFSSPVIIIIVRQAKVAMQQLICFKTTLGRISVLEQIGPHYRELGILLLDDTTGAVTKAILEQYNYDATKIIFEIFERWIQGKGKLPVEWGTLIEVLNDIGLPELANKIEAKTSSK